MSSEWTFGRKLAVGFAVVVAFTVATGGVGIHALRSVVATKDRVIAVHAANLTLVERLNSETERQSVGFRGFVIAREQRFLDSLNNARAEASGLITRLRERPTFDGSAALLGKIAKASEELAQVQDRLLQPLRGTEPPKDGIARTFADEAKPKRDVLDRLVDEYVAAEQSALDRANRAASDEASAAITLVTAAVVGAAALAALVAFYLTRALTRQIGTAVSHIRSSSTELQAAAAQQAAGTREEASAMSEITTTIRELLSTSRQIAESAQQVARIADDTAQAARAGDATVGKGTEAAATIRKQVDQVVTHVLELGKRSQQIGGIVDIVGELAQQTNILSINATIESASAGEHGRRFAALADEIRKLADRVGASAKEIRELVEQVRTAVNAAVMATETGSKAVDAGTRQFAEVAATFKSIHAQVVTTTQAAREIELSTKQQSSAVEQVNTAVANVAQSSKEMEASATQVVATASQLSGLSRDLGRLVTAGD